MTEADQLTASGASPVPPFGDPSRPRRLLKVLVWLVGISVAIVALDLVGVDVTGWLANLWDEITSVPSRYVIPALALQTGQTVFAGLSYYGILRAAYGNEVRFAPIVTAYADAKGKVAEQKDQRAAKRARRRTEAE